jgi:ring-1,2-phenylacetyl-CoA epoxidase subunit PaaC
MTRTEAIYQYLLRYADTSLLLGQRLAEWCSKGPILEEDLALTNIALDHFGQAETLYSLALPYATAPLTTDDLAFRRSEREYYNFLLAEVENGDYAQTLLKIYFLSVFLELVYTKLCSSSLTECKTFAEKSIKEIKYHKRHSSAWLFRLAHGTEESATRVQRAIETLWPFTEDLFATNACEDILLPELNYSPSDIKAEWQQEMGENIALWGATLGENVYMHTGGINQQHTEALGHLLCEMQFLQRAYPDATW